MLAKISLADFVQTRLLVGLMRIDEPDEYGRRVLDDDFLLLLNAHHEDLSFVLPAYQPDGRWGVALDTARVGNGEQRWFTSGEAFPLVARSLALLSRVDRGT